MSGRTRAGGAAAPLGPEWYRLMAVIDQAIDVGGHWTGEGADFRDAEDGRVAACGGRSASC